MNPDRSFLGMTLETANKQAKERGLVVQEVTYDFPDEIFIPILYNPKRINVKLTHGIITEILGRG